jgi:hypothetical protein
MTWTTENYFSKAQLYWQRGSSRGRDSEDFILYLCFTLELISRGAVCRVNPALNAASDLESLLFACGLAPRSPPRSADLQEVIKRLQRLVPELTDAEVANVQTLVNTRNGELHGDTAEIAQLAVNTLMPHVYSFIVKVADFAAQSLDTLLGPEDAETARRTAQAITKDRSRRVQDLIRVCKERFFSLPDIEQQAKRDASKTVALSAVLVSGHHIMYLKCPACAQVGQLLAAPVGRSAPFLRGEELIQEVRVAPFQFACKCCGLDIRGLDELMAAGFGHEYSSMDQVDPVDHFNIDPHDYIDAETVAREYYRENYGDEYRDE